MRQGAALLLALVLVLGVSTVDTRKGRMLASRKKRQSGIAETNVSNNMVRLQGLGYYWPSLQETILNRSNVEEQIKFNKKYRGYPNPLYNKWIDGDPFSVYASPKVSLIMDVPINELLDIINRSIDHLRALHDCRGLSHFETLKRGIMTSATGQYTKLSYSHDSVPEPQSYTVLRRCTLVIHVSPWKEHNNMASMMIGQMTTDLTNLIQGYSVDALKLGPISTSIDLLAARMIYQEAKRKLE